VRGRLVSRRPHRAADGAGSRPRVVDHAQPAHAGGAGGVGCDRAAGWPAAGAADAAAGAAGGVRRLECCRRARLRTPARQLRRMQATCSTSAHSSCSPTYCRTPHSRGVSRRGPCSRSPSRRSSGSCRWGRVRGRRSPPMRAPRSANSCASAVTGSLAAVTGSDGAGSWSRWRSCCWWRRC
jgi:hypothetical protein